MSEKEQIYTVTEDIGIKAFLRRVAGLSATCIKKAKYGRIRKNGEIVHMREQLHAGDVISVRFPEDEPSAIVPIDRPLDVLYEDEDILIVNKPCGMPIHPSRGNHLPTLANLVTAYLGADTVFRAVGRLDRDTSGIVLLAKHAHAAYRLSEAMKAGAFIKEYLAITDGAPTPACGTVDAPIARACEDSMRRVVRADGKPSVTEYRTLGIADDGRALVRLRLLTGRTHQIRVHMAYIGHPLCNDYLYGRGGEDGTYRLHMCRLSFPHPADGRTVTIASEAPFASEANVRPVPSDA
ncbi:MAG: RluA family pseudouridine synthase [Clostridia bacterium]|nr:RluA family pseudouridine synthase [Clostridia bacterium]